VGFLDYIARLPKIGRHKPLCQWDVVLSQQRTGWIIEVNKSSEGMIYLLAYLPAQPYGQSLIVGVHRIANQLNRFAKGC